MGDSGSVRPPAGGFHGTRRFQRVVRRGAGGMGVVYEVIDGERGVRVALKVLSGLGPNALLRLKQEFRVLRDLHHPNLIALHELVLEGGQWFFTMELVDGIDIVSWVRGSARGDDEQQLHEGRLRASFGQLAAALAFLHRAGKVHCDLKPSNVLVTAQGRVVVLDFGIAQDLAEDRRDVRAAGTPAYMAPEQARGERVDAAADWYAFGALLSEALTGSRRPEEAREQDLHAPGGPPPKAEVALAPLHTLRTRLLAADPAARPGVAEVLAALDLTPEQGASGAFTAHERQARAFVGRKVESAAIRRAFEASRRDLSGVLVEGVSGIGKSELVAEAARDIEEEHGACILRGRCHERESLPFKAFDGVVDGLVGHVARLMPSERAALAAPHIDALAQIFPTLLAVPELLTGGSGGAGDVRSRAFSAMKALLAKLAERAPLVLVLDDVHWADADSVALLAELACPPSPRVLLLLTARDPMGGGRCAAAAALGNRLFALHLSGLTRDEVGALVRALEAEGASDDGPELDGLLHETAGHPMFVEELVRFARLRGSGQSSQGPRLDDALRERVAALDDDARGVLVAIAAAGVPTPMAAIATASALRADRFAEALARLVHARLARASGTQMDDVVEPYHDRVRESVYSGLDEEQRRDVHARLVTGLQVAGTSAEVLVLHCQLAGRRALAADYARKAAQRTEAMLAYAKAASFWALAIELAAPEGQKRVELLLHLGEALGRAGTPREAAEAFLEAASVDGLTLEHRFELERRAAQQLLSGGFLDEGRAVAERVLRAVGLRMPRGRLGVLGGLVWHQWRARSAPVGETAPCVAPSAAAARRLDAQWTVGACLSMVDPPVGSLLLSAGLRDALRHGDGFRRARALSAASLSESGQGSPTHALRLTEATERAADAEPSDLGRFYALLARAGYNFLVRRDMMACLEPLRAAEALWRGGGRGAAWETVILEQYTCWALWWAGDLIAFRARWEVGLREARLSGHRYRETVLSVAFPYAHLIDDEPGVARKAIDDAASAWGHHGQFSMTDFWALESRTSTWLYEGELAGADDIEREWERFERSLVGRVRILAIMRELMGYRVALARLRDARARQDPRETARQLARVRRFAERLPGSDEVARQMYGPMIEAVTALAAGAVESGVASLRRSIDVYERHGMQAVATANRRRLGEWIGGHEGLALRDDADAWFAARGVQDRDAFVRMLTAVESP